MQITINYTPSEEPIEVSSYLTNLKFHYKTYERLIDAGLIVATTSFRSYMEALAQLPGVDEKILDRLYGTKIEKILLEFGNSLLDTRNGKINPTIGELIDKPKNELFKYFYYEK